MFIYYFWGIFRKLSVKCGRFEYAFVHRFSAIEDCRLYYIRNVNMSNVYLLFVTTI